MGTAGKGWIGGWLLLEQLLPGATLFALLLWLSYRFLREGFGDVRQYAFAQPAAGPTFARSARRNWWSCTCSPRACACLAALARELRLCCVQSLRPVTGGFAPRKRSLA